MNKILILVTLYVGIAFLVSQGLYTQPDSNITSNHLENKMQTVINPGVPTQVNIPKLDISLVVNQGTYNQEQDTWNISNEGAFFAQESAPLLSDQGNTVIYAHDKLELFGKIHELETGDTITILDDQNKSYTFTYQKSIEVKPTDTSVFYEEDEYQLVLLTCSGLFDQNRLLVFFTPTTQG